MAQNALIISSAVRGEDHRSDWSLRKKFGALMALVAVVPLSALGLISFLHVRHQIRDTALNHLDAVAEVQAARIERAVLENFEVDLPAVLRDPNLQRLMAAYTATRSPNERDALQASLTSHRKVNPFTTEIHVLDLSGLVVASSDPSLIGRSMGYLDYAISGRDHNTSGPIILNHSGEVVHVMAGPLIQSNTTLGVLILESNAQEFVDLTGDYTGLGETGETVLAVRDTVGDALFVTPLRFDPGAAFSRRVPQSSLEVPITQALLGVEAIFTDAVDYRGEPVLAATRYLQASDWAVVVKVDTAEAFSGVYDYEWLLIIVGAMTVGMILLAIWYGARSMTRPIRELTASASAVTRGSLEVRAPVGSADEVGTLAIAFNQMTDSLVEQRRDLEQRVEDRTAELTQSADRLETIVRSRDALVASVSHELRTPLTAIVGLTSELKDHWSTFSDEDREEFVRIVANESTELAQIVEDLLTAARTASGELTFDLETIDLRAITGETLKRLDMGEQEPTLIAAECTWVRADARRIRQILRNLITNALRYGGPQIDIELDCDASSGYLRVCDDGPELSENKRARIFEMYQRETGDASKPASLGIGLTISRQMSRMMHGDLKYRYRDGRTIFELTLPKRMTPGPKEPHDVASPADAAGSSLAVIDRA